jgi:hypothetical protein
VVMLVLLDSFLQALMLIKVKAKPKKKAKRVVMGLI